MNHLKTDCSYSVNVESVSILSLGGNIFEIIYPTIIAKAKEGANTSNSTKYSPILSIFDTTNLKNITDTNPVIIEAIAPFSEYPFQNKDRMITGQKVAAMPDQPKIMIQKICLSG